jgi:DNA mismatch repair protein MutL
MQTDTGSTQKLLFPETIELSPVEASVFKDILPEINKIGFDIQEFGGNSFILHGVPAMPGDQQAADILRRLIAEYIEEAGDGMQVHERVAKAMSLSSAVKQRVRMSAEERLHLIENLFACGNPYFSPSGRRCFVSLSMEELFSRLSAT